MDKKVKMADIADALNISIVTVSKALSGKKGVSEDVREKIKNLADELGYKQPSATKSAKVNESYNIGIIVPGQYFGKYVSFYWQLYQEVITRAVQKQCFTMLEVISLEDENNLEIPKLIQEKKVDGVILMGQLQKDYISKISSVGSIPLICLDFFEESSNCDAVISDSYYGTYMLTNYLFEQGHEEMAYVGTLLFTGSINDRYFGFCKSMMEHGKQVTQDCVINDRDWETGDVAAYKFEFPERMPTAFVCNCDLAACALIKALTEKGYRVPEDISVVGFDNYLYPGLCDIGITTYDVNVKEMARRSINILIKKINTEGYKAGVNIVEGSIVYKESVARNNN